MSQNYLGLVEVNAMDFVHLDEWWADLIAKLDYVSSFGVLASSPMVTTKITETPGDLYQATIEVTDKDGLPYAKAICTETEANGLSVFVFSVTVGDKTYTQTMRETMTGWEVKTT